MSDFVPKFNTLLDIYEHSTAEYADRPFLGTKREGEWQWTTYREFAEAVDQVRGGLASLGIAKGDRVAIISDNREEWAVAAYAAYGLGAIVVPMYESQTDDNWRFILENCQAVGAFVADDAIRDRIVAMRSELPDLEHIIVFDGRPAESSTLLSELRERGAAAPVGLADVKDSDVAGFIYTSGTTGNPKGVVLSHGNLANNASSITSVFPLEPDDGSLSFLPWAHAFGQTAELHTMMSAGGSTAFAESTKHIVANLPEVRPTMLVSVPRVFNSVYQGVQKRVDDTGGIQKRIFDMAVANARKRHRLAEEGKTSRVAEALHAVFDRIVFSKVRERFGGRLKYAVSGGAAISKEVAVFIDSLGIVVYEGYGLSETSPIATANWPGSRKIGSVGKAVPGVRIDIDETASADPRDGEIVIHGHNVMQGYHELPEENAAVFTSDGGFRTGDLGHVDEDGFLYITGRVKEQYKLENGKYVVPTLIEEKVALSRYVANILVYGANRPYNIALVVPDMESLEAWAAAEEIEFDDLDQLRTDPRVRELLSKEIHDLAADFPGYQRIRDFILLDDDFTLENGMLTPKLSVKRRIVIDAYGEQIEAVYAKATQ